MYDIFLSYATPDRQRIQPLVAALRQQGWSVFWDHESVRTGKNWHRTIDEALTTSLCVVVVWTQHSITRDFVLEEATEARDRGVLLPILWDAVRPPLGFRLQQAANFQAWDGRVEHPLFVALAGDIRGYVPAVRVAGTVASVVAVEPPQHTAIPVESAPAKNIATPPVTRLPFEPEMVEIPAGSFTMGWLKERDGEGDYDEKPAHTVNLRRFEIGKYPVTQAQWQAVMGDNPSRFKEMGATCPVERVSWDDVQVFIRKLNVLTGKSYRLPSESEWEYACRAGMNYRYSGSNDIEKVAWYDGNSGGETHPIGQKQANAWGVHDMSGNVLEWVQDTWHESYHGAPGDGRAWEDLSDDAHVLRGSSWFCNSFGSCTVVRNLSNPTQQSDIIGFRLARTLP